MRLAEFYNGVELYREEKMVYARLVAPHRVLSTCRSCTGGLHDDLLYLYNHQSCEPAGGNMNDRLCRLAIDCPEDYKREVAERHSLPFQKCATLGTAANMNNAAICHEKYCDLEVAAVCTGGVEGNAGRAGDPASYYEPRDDGASMGQVPEPDPIPGTINAMIFINRELSPGAMVTAVITATEAKTAALQELEVASRYSEGLATGTGTDQMAVASKLGGKAICFAGSIRRWVNSSDALCTMPSWGRSPCKIASRLPANAPRWPIWSGLGSMSNRCARQLQSTCLGTMPISSGRTS